MTHRARAGCRAVPTRAARRKTRIIGELEAVFQVLAEIPAIIGVDQRRAYGIALAGIMLRRRSSRGSMPSSRAAKSTMVSTT